MKACSVRERQRQQAAPIAKRAYVEQKLCDLIFHLIQRIAINLGLRTRNGVVARMSEGNCGTIFLGYVEGSLCVFPRRYIGRVFIIDWTAAKG